MANMLDFSKKSTVSFQPAPAGIGKVSDQNYIRIHTTPDRRSVILTTHVNGRDEAWITYNAEQLDELIRLLEAHRADLNG